MQTPEVFFNYLLSQSQEYLFNAASISHGLSAADVGHQFHLCSDFEIFLAVENPCINRFVQPSVNFRL